MPYQYSLFRALWRWSNESQWGKWMIVISGSLRGLQINAVCRTLQNTPQSYVSLEKTENCIMGCNTAITLQWNSTVYK